MTISAASPSEPRFDESESQKEGLKNHDLFGTGPGMILPGPLTSGLGPTSLMKTLPVEVSNQTIMPQSTRKEPMQ